MLCRLCCFIDGIVGRQNARKLSAKSGCRKSAQSRTPTNARDNQRLILIVVPIQIVGAPVKPARSRW